MNKSVKSKLTQKQILFCEYYVEDYHATNAAKRAGYSEKTAYAIGSENLTKPEIKQYIEEIKENLEELTGLTKVKILNAHKDIAFSDLTNPESYKISISDKQKSLDSISKMLGFDAPKKVDVTSGGNELKNLTHKERVEKINHLNKILNDL